jgi:hypothetical protein
MPKPTSFFLGWETTVLGNVQIRGRPLSAIGKTQPYSKTLVQNQLTQSVIAARDMTRTTLKLIKRCETDALMHELDAQDMLTYSRALDLVIDMANTHFHVNLLSLTKANASQWKDLFKYLKQVYTMIGQGIGGSLTLVDVTSEGTCGSVSLHNARLLDANDPDGLRIADRGRIHVNFSWCLTRTSNRVGRTIIHEGAHKFIGARDHAYKWNPAYNTLTHNQAMSNADSVACFAYYLWKNGALKMAA